MNWDRGKISRCAIRTQIVNFVGALKFQRRRCRQHDHNLLRREAQQDQMFGRGYSSFRVPALDAVRLQGILERRHPMRAVERIGIAELDNAGGHSNGHQVSRAVDLRALIEQSLDGTSGLGACRESPVDC